MSTDFADKIVLFLCCLVFLFCTPALNADVVPVILALIFSCFIGFFDRELLKAALTAGFILWCIFMPELVIFLPLVCYDVLFTRYWYFSLLSAIPLIFFGHAFGFPAAAEAAVLFVFSAWLRYRTDMLIKLKQERNELRDNAKEMSIRLEKQNRDLTEQQDSEITIAMLNERNRIARDIHDSVGHLLSSSILQVGALLAVNKDEKVRRNLMTLKDTLSSAMNSIRTSVHDLYDESVDLYSQIYELVHKFTFCKLSFHYEIDSEPEKKLKYAFIAIVKESLANIIRHSNATCADISFHEHPALYQLIISDNGTVKDYDPDSGIGLKNIAQRVESFHGNMNILTRNGFEIFISIPKGGTEK